MKTITFIRHGQSVANAGGVSVAHADIPLSVLGERQVVALSQVLPGTASQLMSSSFYRAQQTAAPYAARLGKAVQAHPLLHEFDNFDFNLIAGLNGAQREPLREAYWKVSDPHLRNGPAAETFAEFEQRVHAFLPVLQDLPDRTVIFGHGMWIGLLVWKLLGFSANDALGMKLFRRFQTALPMPNGAVYHLHETAAGHWHARADEAIMLKLKEIS